VDPGGPGIIVTRPGGLFLRQTLFRLLCTPVAFGEFIKLRFEAALKLFEVASHVPYGFDKLLGEGWGWVCLPEPHRRIFTLPEAEMQGVSSRSVREFSTISG